MIVGGYAVMKYTEPRYTKDLDLWVHNTSENSNRLFQGLLKFGAPLAHDGVTPETFTKDNIVYQIGVAPVRVDILTHISGVNFVDAWAKRVNTVLFGVAVDFISRDDLIANKLAVGRPADVEQLMQLRRDTGEGR